MIAPVQNKPVRAVIYTRVSTEEGLDQDFNSLDAQRDAGEAFIRSQQSEGWITSATRYDDGGYSGGNLNRPALERLISDIKAGLIDCVVTYKVDRLNRSLLDFTKLMEVFEKHEVSFVSVTQQINSASSMGRLMLNVLLSFAQFEREIIAERTRDKMRAAKRRGKWIGGRPPLGYDVAETGRALLLNESEAEQVNRIFRLYLETRSITETIRKADELGIRNKRWLTKRGKIKGGDPFTKSSMHRLLTNVLYTGRVALDGCEHAGEHSAIIDPALFDSVQKLLKENCQMTGGQRRSKHEPLLKGLLQCGSCGRGMMHSTTKKGPNRIYRYYVCGKAMKEGWHLCPTKSAPAQEIEDLVVEQIRKIGADDKLQREVWNQFQAGRKEEQRSLSKRLQVTKRNREKLQKRLNQQIKEQSSPEEFELIEEKIRENQCQLRGAQSELKQLEQSQLSREQVESALKTFDPAWRPLSGLERRRLLSLLIRSVNYNGPEGVVTLDFNSRGFSGFLTNHE